MVIECPHCRKTYSLAQACIRPTGNVHFTIVCSQCHKDFDGVTHENETTPETVIITQEVPAVVLETPAVPATRAFRWSRGLFGTPAVDAAKVIVREAIPGSRQIVPAVRGDVTVTTRKR